LISTIELKAYSKVQFLKHCKINKAYPQHISHITKTFLNIFNYKAIRKLKGLISNFKLELIKID